MKKIALHWRILLGMVLGALFGLLMLQFAEGKIVVLNWVKPFGTIFINSLKLIAIPLILASLIRGIANLKDLSTLSKMGGVTISLYLLSTVVAIGIGLLIVNLIKPGKFISEETRMELVSSYADQVSEKAENAQNLQDKSPLQPLVDLVPENIFQAATNNQNMLQVIFFAIFFGVCLVLIDPEKAAPVRNFFDSFNEVILKMIDLIMLAAPFGVFALLAALVVEAPQPDLFQALGLYGLCVLLGLASLIFLYVGVVSAYTKRSPLSFLKGIAPAQLLAFSTSSSAATLPITMECTEENLGVKKEVSSFVLPVGATINMDGTSLYQAVAAIFIAQAFGIETSFAVQLGIVLTATLASIGSAAVPGAGMVMLVIVLAQAGIPEAGLALIFAVDRPLDMCRTVVNITGDAAIATGISKFSFRK